MRMPHICIVGIATGYELDTERSEFESRYSQEFSLLHVFQTGSGAHPASYPIDTGCKATGVKLTTQLKLVQKSRKCGCIYPLPHTPSWLST
jgi:hypothetical protein